ncbi:MAG: endonuclease III domain-containing protein [Thioalkalispiraceae bacterium]|jgi:endonuclease-3 related protein
MLTLYQVYQRLFKYYGPQYWWPAESRFEVMVGAVLTQNTSWTNVEKAIANLKQAKALNCKTLVNMNHNKLAELLKPVGYFNVKAKRLKNFCSWFQQVKKSGMIPTESLRLQLLSINGVGPETADDILLYAFNRPVFVIDAYTYRLVDRLGLIMEHPGYEALRNWFERKLARVNEKVRVFNEYHALIVRHAKEHCRARAPVCNTCCLRYKCVYGQSGC